MTLDLDRCSQKDHFILALSSTSTFFNGKTERVWRHETSRDILRLFLVKAHLFTQREFKATLIFMGNKGIVTNNSIGLYLPGYKTIFPRTAVVACF